MSSTYSQRLRFVGEHGSLGYRTGEVYTLLVWHPDGHAVVIERPGGKGRCPYATVSSFMANWALPGVESGHE